LKLFKEIPKRLFSSPLQVVGFLTIMFALGWLTLFKEYSLFFSLKTIGAGLTIYFFDFILYRNIEGNLKRTIISLIIIGVGLIFLWTNFLWHIFSCGFAGSSPCEEYWHFKIKESEFIEITKEIKKEHPELNPPDTSFNDEKLQYYTGVLFYYPETKEIVCTQVRPVYEDSAITNLSFIGLFSFIEQPKTKHNVDSLRIKLGLSDSPPENNNYVKEINRDFDYFANKKELWKFKHRILELIRQKIEQRQK
jgi:hypothetical protein